MVGLPGWRISNLHLCKLVLCFGMGGCEGPHAAIRVELEEGKGEEVMDRWGPQLCRILQAPAPRFRSGMSSSGASIPFSECSR